MHTMLEAIVSYHTTHETAFFLLSDGGIDNSE